MNGESQIEVILSILVLGLSTALATGYIRLPRELSSSPAFIAVVVIIALVAFSVFPMTGLSMFFLLAVIVFSRNVDTTMQFPHVDIREYANNVTLPAMPDFHSATVATHPVTERPEVLHTGNTGFRESVSLNSLNER